MSEKKIGRGNWDLKSITKARLTISTEACGPVSPRKTGPTINVKNRIEASTWTSMKPTYPTLSSRIVIPAPTAAAKKSPQSNTL